MAPNIQPKTYIGLMEGEWKSQYNNHKQSFTYTKNTLEAQHYLLTSGI